MLNIGDEVKIIRSLISSDSICIDGLCKDKEEINKIVGSICKVTYVGQDIVGLDNGLFCPIVVLEKVSVENYKMSEFKIGDKVKIVRKPTLSEQALHPLWLNEMDETVGKISRITSILDNGDVKLENSYWYPPYVLEKVPSCFQVGEPCTGCNSCNLEKECNPTGEEITEVKQPICPINLYFEGDEDKCDAGKCDWDTETRSCSEACRKIKQSCDNCGIVICENNPDGNPEIKDYLLDKDKVTGLRTTHTDKELFESKDAMLPGKGIAFHKFEKPDCRILKTFNNPQQNVNYTIEISTHELTALCPLTSFPDFYDLKISYRPALKCIESKSAKFYFHSFRDFGGFIETLANRIADDWVKACAPKWLKVELTMAPRGGIPITVIVERNQPLMIV